MTASVTTRALLVVAVLCVGRTAAAQGEAEPQPEPPITAPVARPAPATEAATRGSGPLRAGLEVFAQYS
jgi:hypothetical protein